MNISHAELQKILEDHLISMSQYRKNYDSYIYSRYTLGQIQPDFETQNGHKFIWVDLPGEDPDDYAWLKEEIKINLASSNDLAIAIKRTPAVITGYKKIGLIEPIYFKEKKSLYWLPEVVPRIGMYFQTFMTKAERAEYLKSLKEDHERIVEV